MRIAGTVSLSVVNGDGIRFVVFVQGCKHGCPGCQNPDTWPMDGGYEISVKELAAEIRRHPYIDGVTLSGGDPMYQQKECLKLIALLPEMDFWCYTGFEWNEIQNTEMAKKCTMVTGPYVEALRCEGMPYGSSNQEIHRINKEK